MILENWDYKKVGNNLDLKECYIWLDEIRERAEKDNQEDKIFKCIDLCKLLIKEKITGYADERVKRGD
ncbi:hypothetical protein CF067_00835 [Clostridium sporogenes]